MASEHPSPSDLEAALHSVVDDTADQPEASGDSVEHLDAVRIQQLTKLRRATIRSRSWCLIGAVVGFVAAAELVFKIVQSFRYGHGWGLLTAAFVLCAIASGVIAVFFFVAVSNYIEKFGRRFCAIRRRRLIFRRLATGASDGRIWKR